MGPVALCQSADLPHANTDVFPASQQIPTLLLGYACRGRVDGRALVLHDLQGDAGAGDAAESKLSTVAARAGDVSMD